MAANEFKEARHKLRLSVGELAVILNINPRTIRNWEDAAVERPPNPVAPSVVEWLLNGFWLPQWPEGQR